MTIAVDVRDLVGHPGASRTVRVAEAIEGLGTELARLREDEPVVADLLLESVVEGILVSGGAVGPLAETCARCLKPFEVETRVEVRELFAPGADPEGDEYPLPADGRIDVEPMLRDALGLALPFSPLCRPDCLGLCPRCGGDRNLGECSCRPEADPRWAGLAGLELPGEPGGRAGTGGH